MAHLRARTIHLFAVFTAALGAQAAAPINPAFFARHDYQIGQTGQGPTAVAVADFNGDGRPDMAVVGSDEGEVIIMLGGTNGEFQKQFVYNAGFEPEAILADDFNSDGHPDIAVSNFFGTVTVFLGNGDGTFSTGISYGPGNGDGSEGIADGDFNRDGTLDILISTGLNDCLLFPGKGDGSFQAPTTIACGSGGEMVAAGDLNHDGNLDFVVTGSEFGGGAILLGNGNGTFKRPTTFFTPADMGVAIADLNGDGNPDIILAFPGSSTESVGVLLGNGDGTFQPLSTFAGGNIGAQSVAVGDFNGDGLIDVAIANRESGTPGVSVLLGNGAGGLGAPVQYAMPDPYALIVAGVHTVGEPDIVVANTDTDTISVLFRPKPGVIEAAPNLLAGTGVTAVAIGDWNHDGKADVAIVSGQQNNVTVYLQSAAQTFHESGVLAVGTLPEAIVSGDFNNDGKLDLATVNEGLDNVSVLLGNGNGKFRSAMNFGAGTNPVAAAAADVNGDGNLDLLVVNAGSANVSVLFGNGDGTFRSPVNYAVGVNPSSIAVGDVNGDGILDLAVSNFGAEDAPGTVSVLLGTGKGKFNPQIVVPTGGVNAKSVAIADFNGDGFGDLVVSNFDNGSVTLLTGLGNGMFQLLTTVEFGDISEPGPLVAADFNGDGKPDVAVVLQGLGCIAVLRGTGSGFAPALLFGASNEPVNLALGDLNGDGKLDLAVANLVGNNASLLFNIAK